MQYRILQAVIVAVLLVGLCGCEMISGRAKKEAPAQAVALSDVPEPARAVIEKLVAGGEIKRLEKEESGGKVLYDVEARVGDKDVEYDVASDGRVLSAEESVPYSSVPAVVRAAAEKYFGSAEGLKAYREIEGGKTYYEVEGKKGSAAMALKLDETGKVVEEEKAE